MAKKLTAKQKKFADEYIVSGNAYQSAIKAGYSENYAKNARKKMVDSGGKISQYIYDHMDKTDDNRIATAEEVLQTLTKILRMELYETTEEVNPVTGEVVELKNSPKLSDVNRAGAELLKRYPLAAESKKMELEIEKLKQQVEGDDDHNSKISEYLETLKGVVMDD